MRDLIKICSGKPRRKLPEEGNQPCERRSVARVPPSPPGGPISPSLSLSFPPPPRNPIFPTSHPLPSCPPGGGVGGACLTGSFSGRSAVPSPSLTSLLSAASGGGGKRRVASVADMLLLPLSPSLSSDPRSPSSLQLAEPPIWTTPATRTSPAAAHLIQVCRFPLQRPRYKP